jgi:PIN domain nuclease of toxin-antitoxin system
MSALLMDTHALVWLTSGQVLEPAAQAAVVEAQGTDGLWVSAISAWEAGAALTKRSGRPDLGGLTAAAWFRAVLALPGTRLVQITRRIALEAADVPARVGHSDPGDCFLIATARVKRLPIMTRDDRMLRLARERTDYLSAIAC